MKNVSILCALMLVFCSTCVTAQNFSVNTPENFQAALTSAQSNGEADVIYVAPGTYSLTQTLMYLADDGDEALTITAANQAMPPILDGQNGVQMLHINNDLNDDGAGDANAPITIRYISFRNGNGVQNGIPGFGGGLQVETGQASINMEHCTFNNNSSDHFGGGAYFHSKHGVLSVRNCTFSENSATHLGGGFLFLSDTGSATASDNTFTNNRVTSTDETTGGGGMVVFSGDGSIVVTGNTFTDNQAGWRGGGARIGNHTNTITVTDNVFTGNQAGEKGGGTSVGTYGNDTLTVLNNTFGNNSAGDDGGGLFLKLARDSRSQANVSNNTFNGNTASDKGGAFKFLSSHGRLNITNNTAYGNNANYGGGLNVKLQYNDASSFIYNNIIYGNNAGGKGDDIYINSDAEPDQNGNTVGDGVGSAVALFNNDIGPDNDNYSGNSADLIITDIDNYTNGNNIDADPSLRAPSSGDFHIVSTSPCIDAGTNSAPGMPAVDFDGEARIADGNNDGTAIVDIGADEAGGAVIHPVPAMNHLGLILLTILLALTSVYGLKPTKNTTA